jgi:hypothetical protein
LALSLPRSPVDGLAINVRCLCIGWRGAPCLLQLPSVRILARRLQLLLVSHLFVGEHVRLLFRPEAVGCSVQQLVSSWWLALAWLRAGLKAMAPKNTSSPKPALAKGTYFLSRCFPPENHWLLFYYLLVHKRFHGAYYCFW